MGTNLRLSDELADALRAESARTGRSQQEIVRSAIAQQLGIGPDITDMQRAVRSGLVEAPDPFRDVEPSLELPTGVSTLDLLDRDER